MSFMKKPCANCPYRIDVKPYLTPERGEELATIACNPHNTFWCHTTTESVETEHGSDRVAVETTQICAGFLSLQHNINGETSYDDEGFKPSPLVYEDNWQMSESYEDEEVWQEIVDIHAKYSSDKPT